MYLVALSSQLRDTRAIIEAKDDEKNVLMKPIFPGMIIAC